MIEILNYHLRSQKWIALKKWAEKYFESLEIRDSDIIRKKQNNQYINKFEVVKYENDGIELDVKVSPNEDTVWLTKEEMCILFDRDKSVISRHINNLFSEGELDKNTSVHFLHISLNKRNPNHRPPEYYNLDVIISVGYRVKSQNGIE